MSFILLTLRRFSLNDDYRNNISDIKIKSITEKRVAETSEKEIRQFYHCNLKVNWKDTKCDV